MDTLSRLQRVFREVLDQPELTLAAEMTPDAVEGWDSLAQVRLVFAVQEEFGLEFETHMLPQLNSVGRLVEAIESRQG